MFKEKQDYLLIKLKAFIRLENSTWERHNWLLQKGKGNTSSEVRNLLCQIIKFDVWRDELERDYNPLPQEIQLPRTMLFPENIIRVPAEKRLWELVADKKIVEDHLDWILHHLDKSIERYHKLAEISCENKLPMDMWIPSEEMEEALLENGLLARDMIDCQLIWLEEFQDISQYKMKLEKPDTLLREKMEELQVYIKETFRGLQSYSFYPQRFWWWHLWNPWDHPEKHPEMTKKVMIDYYDHFDEEGNLKPVSVNPRKEKKWWQWK